MNKTQLTVEIVSNCRVCRRLCQMFIHTQTKRKTQLFRGNVQLLRKHNYFHNAQYILLFVSFSSKMHQTSNFRLNFKFARGVMCRCGWLEHPSRAPQWTHQSVTGTMQLIPSDRLPKFPRKFLQISAPVVYYANATAVWNTSQVPGMSAIFTIPSENLQPDRD